MLIEDGLDFFELDAEAANLDLQIEAPEVLDVTALEPADEVAAPVEASPGRCVWNGWSMKRAAVSSGRVR